MKDFKNHILVPIDFSEQSLIALSQSFNIARFQNCEITLLHVFENDFMDKLKSFFKSDEDSEKMMRNETQKRLDEIAKDVNEKTGLHVNTMVADGDIHEEILRVSQMLNTSLIIMGTTGTSKFTKRFIGSNAWRVINDAECPVISIKGKHHREGCKRILLPLDVTRETRDKVSYAIELAKYFNSEIYLISMYETEDEYIINKVQRQMEQVRFLIQEDGIVCNAEMVKSSELGKTVLDFAHKIEADLIMIMTQQDLDITEWFIGSAAQEIINNSETPVLSVRPKKRKDTTVFAVS